GYYRASSYYYMNSLSIATVDHYVGMQLINFVAMGDLRLDENRFEEARSYCKRARDICQAIEDDHHICGVMYMISGKVEQREAGLHEGQQACTFLEEALVYFEKARDLFNKTQAHAY